MNENDVNNICNDALLRKAAARHETRMPQMPPGLNKRLMERVRQSTAARKRVRWIWSAAASIAAIAIGLATLIPRTVRDASGKDAALAVADRPHKLALPNTTRQEQAENASGHTGKAVSDQTERTGSLQTQPTDSKQAKNEQAEDEQAEDASALTEEPANTAEYIAQLAKMYKAASMPLDCRDDGDNMVYVFNDDGYVMQHLGVLALWIDTDKPGVSFTISPDQMTLELDAEGRARGVSETWLADRRNGLVYLYHSRTTGDIGETTDCYMSFIGHNDCKRSN